MTVFNVPRQSPDLRRQGYCPTCQALQGERCFGRVSNGVHSKRLERNGLAVTSLPPMPGARRRRRRQS
ncbi:hypothetical protein RCO28_26960 [Streptomyces sp. LHD-70]|uniref:hypothetical protein n=1 Tax=Streptomyces sp. LHD-70 TaxID=3072140 RepID=UPI00280DC0DB|nr:hypothetical protein [Streptomyces sp. LHD-70]MDQ8706086.1 hypothetical protein [Streptomyces sp. LHD-70]